VAVATAPTPGAPTPGAPGAGAPDVRVRIQPVSPASAATTAGSALAALALDWVLFERVLPLSGVLGFWLVWYLLFLVLYWAMASMQWDRLEAANRITGVAFGTAGVLALTIVITTASYTLVKGWGAVKNLGFLTSTMQFSGPLQPLTDGGALHAIVGSLEQIAVATLFSVPLGIAAALFLAEVGGPLATPVRTIVEAMTALPDLIAGLFIYSLFILSLGFTKSGMMASLALAVTMIPIVTRASEVVIRIVPGTLREASYALGASQWRTVWSVVLPTARAGLSTAIVLAMARGIGETAPVLLTAGITKNLNANPFSGPQINLPLFIWNYVHIQGQIPADYIRGFGGAFVLVVVVLVLFAVARRLGGSAPGELSKRQRRKLSRQARPI
jgi:phosphate transport system permease protein